MKSDLNQILVVAISVASSFALFWVISWVRRIKKERREKQDQKAYLEAIISLLEGNVDVDKKELLANLVLWEKKKLNWVVDPLGSKLAATACLAIRNFMRNSSSLDSGEYFEYISYFSRFLSFYDEKLNKELQLIYKNKLDKELDCI